MSQSPDSPASDRCGDLTRRQVQFFHLGLGLYCVLHVVLRTLLSPTVELDEGEQVMHATGWRWGYFHNPPLYTWLQLAFFEVFGLSVLALSILKNVILFCFYCGVYQAGRRLGGTRLASVAATAGMAFIPSILFLSQRDLTHSVLATAVAPWLLIALWDVQERRRLADYLRLGFWLTLAVYSKYLSLMLVVAVAAAWAIRSRDRAALLDRRILLSLAIPFLAGLPHFLWLLTAAEAQSEISRKLRPSSLDGWWIPRFVGTGKMLLSAVEFCAASIGIYLLIFRRSLADRPFSSWPSPAKTLTTGCLLLLGLLWLAVVLGFLSDFKARWYQASLFVVPLILALATDLPELRRGLRRIAWIGAWVALIILVAVPARAALGARFGSILRVAAPFEQVAEQVAAQVSGPRLILANDRGWGASWKLRFVQDEVRVPEYPEPADVSHRTIVVVWECTPRPRNPNPALPEPLRQLALELTGRDPLDYPEERIELPYRFGSRRMMQARYIIMPPAGMADLPGEGP